MEKILTFCKNCGELLSFPSGNQIDSTCPNCSSSIINREERIQGFFSKWEAKNLFRANGWNV